MVLLYFSAPQALAGYPLITDDADTQGTGKYQIISSGEFDADRDERTVNDLREPVGTASQTAFINLNLTAGVRNNVDFTVNLPYG